MGAIEIRGVEKWFDALQVIEGVDLSIADGEFVVLVGPSGCGKSTLLRLVAGLEDVSRGTILIDGRDVTAEPPGGRGLAMVFQSYALYPHLTVAENLGFALKNAGVPRREIDARVGHAAGILKLDAFLDRLPKQLSGGQRQRVAIGRAIVREPAAFLFDEPLSNLDAALRGEMRYEIAKLRQALGATMLYVTHDQIEAMTLADRIVVLQSGRIEQVGSPRELYEKPGNLFVARFIGSPRMNVLPAGAADGRLLVAGRPVPGLPALGAAHLGIRPEHLALVAPGDGILEGTVEVVEYLGADSMAFVDCGGPEAVTVRAEGDIGVRVGERVGLSFGVRLAHLFDADGRRLAVPAAVAA